MYQIAKLLLPANPGIAAMGAEVLPLWQMTLRQARRAEAAVMLLRSGPDPRASLERWAGDAAVMLKAAGSEAAPLVHRPAGSKASKMTATEAAGMASNVTSMEAARMAAAEASSPHMAPAAHVAATAHMTSAAVSAPAVMLGERRCGCQQQKAEECQSESMESFHDTPPNPQNRVSRSASVDGSQIASSQGHVAKTVRSETPGTRGSPKSSPQSQSQNL